MRRETIHVRDYAKQITQAMDRGILLNTQGEKFNSMMLGWGFLGEMWGRECFTAYVKDRRYTKQVLDSTREFTLSIPLGEPDTQIMAVCGLKSGRKVDKVKEAGLILCPPRTNHTPGILQYPLTLECRLIYSQRMDISAIPEDIQLHEYLEEGEALGKEGIKGCHTAYMGEILDTYILHE